MKSGVEYDPYRVQYTTAEKESIRLLFALSAAHARPVKHMDIFNAYIHEPNKHYRPVHVKSIYRSDGKYVHDKRNCGLYRNIWGGKSAGVTEMG